MSESDTEEDNIPDRETCEGLTQQFAEVTGTDVALAQYYLQDRNWDLQAKLWELILVESLQPENVHFQMRSLDAYFEELRDAGFSPTASGSSAATSMDYPGGSRNAKGDEMFHLPPSLIKNQLALVKPPDTGLKPKDGGSKLIRFLTWNLDGLDARNLKIRTKAVIKIVQEENPDVVFFQEVVPESLQFFRDRLEGYNIVSGNGMYFTACLLNRATCRCDSHRIIPYPGSSMGRNLLVLQGLFNNGSVMTLMNTHLESTKDFADERMEQLRIAFREMKKSSSPVILAGDLNLRDKEIEAIGGLPEGTFDAWIQSGQRKECQYTFDGTRNSNIQLISLLDSEGSRKPEKVSGMEVGEGLVKLSQVSESLDKSQTYR
ncbi:unnamed protein product [Darwinula stevensoni]|uniref:5'-tyrosyl-DNA phosphodiesterase n=1 Tax=Darwinula stevensoni TaxID=69355 RepID=A0A7R8X110_9CRUS|nr:unnamed protein product [Darwinula stevensoni]CAG0881755.1 unnamed protein product [Darwinula stevensoni]